MHTITASKTIPEQIEVWRRNLSARKSAYDEAQVKLEAAQAALDEAQSVSDLSFQEWHAAQQKVIELEEAQRGDVEFTEAVPAPTASGVERLQAFMLDPQAMQQTFEQISLEEKKRYLDNCMKLMVGLSPQVPELGQLINTEAAQARFGVPLQPGQMSISQCFTAQAQASSSQHQTQGATQQQQLAQSTPLPVFRAGEGDDPNF